MHCLLCHEKIPRLRAWTGKSEFCCDEHAELYKKQTVERLLVGEGEKDEDAPALPIAKELPTPIAQQQSQPKPCTSDDAESTDELWKLAEKMAPEKPPVELGAVSDEKADAGNEEEDAIAALRALADEARAASAAAADDGLAKLESEINGVAEVEASSADADDEEATNPPELQPEALAADAAAEDQSDPAPELDLDALGPEPAAQGADLDPPELAFADEDAGAAEEETPVAKAAKSAPKKRPKLRPVQKLTEVVPVAFLPEGGYPLKPWTDALEVAGPDRVSLLDPVQTLELRQACLNGTEPRPPEAESFQPSSGALAVNFPAPAPKVDEPEFADVAALEPSDAVLWPKPLYAALGAPEMTFREVETGSPTSGGMLPLDAPVAAESFLSLVAFDGQVMEPRSSAILSPPEREVFVMASADDDTGGGGSADDGDGGERAHVADLF